MFVKGIEDTVTSRYSLFKLIISSGFSSPVELPQLVPKIYFHPRNSERHEHHGKNISAFFDDWNQLCPTEIAY